MARYFAGVIGALACLLACTAVHAQYSRIDAPFGTIGNSFSESIGVSWSLQGNGWFARFGGPVMPAFGGFDPGAAGQFGMGFRSGNVSGFLNFTAGQGSDSFLGSVTPSVVVPHGGFGFVSDTLQRPFVLGFVPVVGSEPVSPVKQALARLEADGVPGSERGVPGAPVSGSAESDSTPHSALRTPHSSAERGEESIAQIRAKQAAEELEWAAEVDALAEKASQAAAAGKPGLARIYLRQARRHAGGSRQTELEARLKAIEEQLTPPADR